MASRIKFSYFFILVTLTFAFLLKVPCLILPWGAPTEYQYKTFCYNDIQGLHSSRALAESRFPYVQEKYEYPVVIGVSMWFASLFAKTHQAFFVANALILALIAFFSAKLLSESLPDLSRLKWFVFALPLFLHGFTNWDLWLVFSICLSFWAFSKNNIFLLGASFGIGTSTKLLPAFGFAAFFIHYFFNPNERKNTWILIKGFAAAYAAINLPIIIADCIAHNGWPEGWLGVFAFHAKRIPDYETIWYFLSGTVFSQNPTSDEYREIVDRITSTLFGAFSLFAFFRQKQKRSSPFQTLAEIILFLLIITKIHSPQYSLWLIPFFAWFRVPPSLILLYFFSDLSIVLTRYPFYVAMTGSDWRPLYELNQAATLFRAFALILLLVWFLNFKGELRANPKQKNKDHPRRTAHQVSR